MQIEIKTAYELQNATVNFANQNNSIKIAIEALKSITHRPLGHIANTEKFLNKNDYFGITEEDRKTISDFIKFLETKEMPMGELFKCITNQ